MNNVFLYFDPFPSEGIHEEDQQWFFNFSGETSAMESSPEIFARLAFWRDLLEG